MRIAYILTLFPSMGGVAMLNQIKGAMDSGHEVDIYAQAPNANASGALHADVHNYHMLDRVAYVPKTSSSISSRVDMILRYFPIAAKTDFIATARALNIFKYGTEAANLRLFFNSIPYLKGKRYYDIVHCQQGKNGVKAIKLMEIGAIRGRLVTSFHGGDVNTYPLRYGANVYADLFARGDAYTANTCFTAQKAISLGCPKERLITMHSGIDVSSFRFQVRQLKAGETVNIMTVARLIEGKGIEYSIAAMRRVVEAFPEVRYWIVGDGPLRSRLEDLTLGLGLSKHVEFKGWRTQEDLKSLYAETHIFVLPSVRSQDGTEEAQGLVLQEAQACGIPVVASHVGGIPESILENSSGFLVPERDPDALAGAIFRLISHPEEWAEMGQAGRKFVEENFDVNVLNQRLMALYGHISNGGLPAECDLSIYNLSQS